ncbi:hypothetical protein [Rhodococcus sp. ACT016]|uniref:hypothetical protein n=1 Tax=Rhodococcus sp. ACT016 TaxID=3134808 RepID=UPI003D28D3D2
MPNRRTPILLVTLPLACAVLVAAAVLTDRDAGADTASASTESASAMAPFAEAVTAAERAVRNAPFAGSATELAEGLDYVRGLTKNAVRMAWNDDPDFPRMEQLTAADGKVGLDNPDAIYMRAPLRDDAEYVVTGTRSTVKDLSFQILSGDYLALPFPQSLAAFGDNSFTIAPDGSYSFRLSPHCSGARDCVALPQGSGVLFTREVYSDWDTERRGSITIRRSDRIGAAPEPTTPDREAARFRAAADFLTGQVSLWIDFTSQMYGPLPPNTLTQPKSTAGGLPTQYSSTGTYSLADDEALIVTVPRSAAPYQGIQLGSDWYVSLDYINHSTSLTADQARTDPDGQLRFVVSRQDPGLANWLETTGHDTGYIHLRWQGQTEPLTDVDKPTVEVVKVSELPRKLPFYAQAGISPEQYRQAIAARQIAVADRMIS